MEQVRLETNTIYKCIMEVKFSPEALEENNKPSPESGNIR